MYQYYDIIFKFQNGNIEKVMDTNNANVAICVNELLNNLYKANIIDNTKVKSIELKTR